MKEQYLWIWARRILQRPAFAQPNRRTILAVRVMAARVLCPMDR